MESFHSRFRDECLNREQLWTLTEARVVIEDFRQQYNTHRPHSRLGYIVVDLTIGHTQISEPGPLRHPTYSLLGSGRALRPPSAKEGQTAIDSPTSPLPDQL